LLRVLIFLQILVYVSLSFAEDFDAEAACSRLIVSQPNKVSSAIPELLVDESTTTTEDLAVMSGLYNDIGRSIGGITSAQALVESEVISNMALLPNQRGVCAKPAINMRVGYQSLSVFMDRELVRSSCIYNAIFAHEMHHVAIYKDYVSEHLAQIQQSADDKFNGKVYFFPTLFQAKQYIETLGQVFAQHVRDKFTREVNARQAALDTQAEYSRMQLECTSTGYVH